MSGRDMPPPSVDMTDGEAATWLLDIADIYEGTDRRHVQLLAQRLRSQWDAGIAEIKAAHDAMRAEVKRIETELDTLDSEVQDLEWNRRSLEADLKTARSSLSEVTP